MAGVRAGGGRRWCELGGRFGGDASLWWWQPCACENSQTCTLYTSSLTVCGPATSWKIDGETVETVRDFIFLGSKITADGDCSHEIKRRLLIGRKAMTNLDSILKSRDITLMTKVHLVKVMVFPVQSLSRVQLFATP